MLHSNRIALFRSSLRYFIEKRIDLNALLRNLASPLGMYALKAQIYLSLGQRPRHRYATISSAEGATQVSPMLTSRHAYCDYR
jgi:hypothetical protein